MDVRMINPADIAARRFEREHAESAKHKPHVLAPDDISTDVVAETGDNVARPKAKDPREERKGRPAHPAQESGLQSQDSTQITTPDESDGEHQHLDVRV